MTTLLAKKITLQFFFFVSISSVFYSCLVPEKSKTSKIDSININKGINIDTLLAKQLEADDYGMKTYIIAFLKKGRKRWMIDSVTANKLQKTHLENIERLADEGKLVLAGPFTDHTDLQGIYIFNVRTVAEAEQLCSTDPAIQAESLAMEFHTWYGSAAILKVKEIHKAIAKRNY